MSITRIMEKQLAEATCYDITYLSKWINGSKLPSERNVSDIVFRLSQCFAEHMSEEECTRFLNLNNRIVSCEERRHLIQNILQTSWENDFSYKRFYKWSHKQVGFIDDRSRLFLLMEEAVRQMLFVEKENIEIILTFDPYRELGTHFFDILSIVTAQQHKKDGPELCLTIAVDSKTVEEKGTEFCEGILKTLIGETEINLTVKQRNMAQPHIALLGDFMYIQCMYAEADRFAACYSIDPDIVRQFRRIITEINVSSENLINHASPGDLRDTNVQLDSYSHSRTRFFFNEAPAMLIPSEVIQQLKETPECEDEYREYLTRLDHVFSDYTRNAKVDLMVYSSALTRYVRSGEISIGNVQHVFNAAQIRAHITYIAQVMNENPEFHVYLRKDTIGSHDKWKDPSIFVDEVAVTIENSLYHANASYHISMVPKIRECFLEYFDEVKERPECSLLTYEELLRYLS